MTEYNIPDSNRDNPSDPARPRSAPAAAGRFRKQAIDCTAGTSPLLSSRQALVAHVAGEPYNRSPLPPLPDPPYLRDLRSGHCGLVEDGHRQRIDSIAVREVAAR